MKAGPSGQEDMEERPTLESVPQSQLHTLLRASSHPHTRLGVPKPAGWGEEARGHELSHWISSHLDYAFMRVVPIIPILQMEKLRG